MSASDDNVKDVPSDNHEEGHGNGSIGFVILFFVVGLIGSLLTGWVLFPKLLYSQKEQPIDFNHQIHMDAVSDGCESCHFFREDGSFSGVPTIAQCIECHEEAQTEDPNEIKLVQEYIANGEEVPWLVYARQPDCVFFSHAAHKEMDCTTCHGDIGHSENLKTYEENRLTGYSRDIWGHNIGGFKKNTWDRMKMDDCAECHERETGSKGPCFQCHK
ncbi:MAG: cytochrome C [Proteobacteria bacterium]|nr:cytochrome C [Pseudomonadota bacterium]